MAASCDRWRPRQRSAAWSAPSSCGGASSRRAKSPQKTRQHPSIYPANELQPVRQLDLNADVGEGDPDADAALLRLVTSANIACGLHAGDPHTMRTTVALSVSQGVAVGAHPGYNDREGFGRRPQQLTADEIRDLLVD